MKTTKHQKSVTLYWKYFDVKRSQPISVQTSRTGGNQQLTLHDEGDYNYIVTVMTDSFFPDGNNTFGLLKQINIKIGSFKGDFTQQPFCLKDYLHQDKLWKTRIYLMMRKISNKHLLKKMTYIPLSLKISEGDDIEFPDLKPIETKQSRLVTNSQPVSWSNISPYVDDIDTFLNSLLSTSTVAIDVNKLNESEI